MVEILRFRNESGYLRFRCPSPGCAVVSSRGGSVVDHARDAHGLELDGYKPRPRTPTDGHGLVRTARVAPATAITDIGEVPETVLVTVHNQSGQQEAFRVFNLSYARVCEVVRGALTAARGA